MKQFFTQPPENSTSYNSISATFFHGSTRHTPDSYMANNRFANMLSFKLLRCGFLTASILGCCGRSGPFKSAWGLDEKSGGGIANGVRHLTKQPG
jgi:hypothetical protein